MKSSPTLEELDRLLGEACSALDEAAGNASSVGPERERPFKRIVADALVRVWDARDIIHAQRPDLKPEFAREADADPDSCEAYLTASRLAHRLALEDKSDEAIEVLNQFADSTSSRFFSKVARQELTRFRRAI